MASVYRQNGYQVEATGGGGPDGGVDLKLFKDAAKTCRRNDSRLLK
jgi:hypothetical protein